MPRDTISNGSMQLSCVQPAHIESIRLWRNKQMAILRQNSAISKQQQISYYDTQIWPTLVELYPCNILLSIHQQNTLIGYGGLVHIAWHDRRAEVSFLLNPDLVKSNETYSTIFSEYIELVSELAFQDLSLNRLFTETWSSRKLHMKTLEQCGFNKEGVLRAHTIQNGVATDSIIHGKLATAS